MKRNSFAILFRRESLWSPLDIPDCVLWLDAAQISGLSDGDPVTSWPDMSGLGNHAVEAVNPPTYKTGIQNGLPIVRFDGADRLTVASFATNNFGGITQMTTFVIYNPRGDTGYNVLDLGAIGQHWRFVDGGFYCSYFRSTRSVNDPPGQPADSNFHYHTLRSGPVGAYDIWRNGVGGSEYAQSWGVTSDDLVIANGGDGGGLAGDIAEIIIYARELGDDEVATVEANVPQAKWDL